MVLTGTLRQDARVQGGYGLDVKRLAVLQVADHFPFSPKGTVPDF